MDTFPKRQYLLRQPWFLMLHYVSAALLLLCILVAVAIRFYPAPFIYPELPRLTRTHSGGRGDPVNVFILVVGNR